MNDMGKESGNPAEESAKKSIINMCSCIDKNQSFVLEAGAGSGKTYSLKYALKYLLQVKGVDLIRQRQKIACISYTKVASEQILLGVDKHPAIYSSTIHAFFWLLIKDYQKFIRTELSNLKHWPIIIEDNCELTSQSIGYNENGFRTINETHISLHHDDILCLTVKLLNFKKFRTRLVTCFPILFIDEYQDTNKEVAQALLTKFVDSKEHLLIGFFGDHWQKIYGDGCGKIEHPRLKFIPKNANFRSAPEIVNVLNRLRPELLQQVKDPTLFGSVSVYHTNEWVGARRTGQHWDGDLPSEIAHTYLQFLKNRLEHEGWDLSPEKTKILMLTHKVLAKEQGYDNLAEVFKNNDAFIKKTDPHIAFFIDILEPVCISYANKKFGEMFTILGNNTPPRSNADKKTWINDMNKLLTLRDTATVGEVIDHLRQTNRPHLPDGVERKEYNLKQWLKDQSIECPSSLRRLEVLRGILYREVIYLSNFYNNYTPFKTKHGVKGAEFENVLVVVGRGWNHPILGT